jgi:hypothetical protein
MATASQIASDPRFAKATPEQKQRLLARAEDAPTSFRENVLPVAKQAISEATFQPGTVSRDFATNPVTQAKALPALAGAGVSLAGAVPMGLTIGTVGGRKLSNLALKAYGKQDEIPSGMSQAVEAILAAGGDLTAIPYFNKKVYGSQIGSTERAAGVPAPQDIPSTPMALGQKTVGEFINDAVDSVKSSAGKGVPAYWKTIKDQVDRIYELGKDQGLTNLDTLRLRWLSNEVQSGLNAVVPGRAAPAEMLARSQGVPNFGKAISKAVPKSVKTGLGWGAGGSGGAGLAYALGRRLFGEQDR